MNQIVQSFNTDGLTMSTREIAQLLNKRHDNVLRTARELSSSGVTQSEETHYKHEQNGQIYPEHLLNKRDCLVLVAWLSPEFTAKVVDRWQELESQSYVRLPNFNNPAEAARAWAEVYEEKSKLALEHQVTLEENTHLKSHFIDGMKIVDFARSLNGVNTMQVQKFLLDRGWLRRDGFSGWRVNAQYRDRYLAERTTIWTNPNTLEEQERHYPVLLRAGAVKLFDLYSKGLLPMKANWNGKIGHASEAM